MEQNNQVNTLDKVEWVFVNIQNLQIVSNEHNLKILGTAHKVLRNIFSDCENLLAENEQLKKNIESLKEELKAATEPEGEENGEGNADECD